MGPARFVGYDGFPLRIGSPDSPFFRAKEHLGRHIQTGGADVGHSSVEDSVASLDLVKWHVINGERAGSMGTQNPRR